MSDSDQDEFHDSIQESNMPNADQVSAVSLKLPEFWTTTPAGWFHTVEAQFHVRNITADETQYYYVVSALGSSPATAIAGFLNNPPAANRFQAIRTELLKVYEPSEQQKKRTLTSLGDLGDRKPTELLRYMKTLHNPPKDDVLFMTLFLDKLPPTARAILAATKWDDIDKLAEAADEVVAQDTGHLPTAAVRYKNNRNSQPNRPAQSQQPGVCWYHRKWGKDAQKCTAPCSYQGNGQASH